MNITGQSNEPTPGFYVVKGSGADIWDSSDTFHYMYLETSGDITFTVLVEDFSATSGWAKGGVSIKTVFPWHFLNEIMNSMLFLNSSYSYMYHRS